MSDNSQFSEREKEVTELLLQGKSNKQIALVLGISASTVEYHLKNVYKKLQVNSRTEAVLRLGKSIGGNVTGELGKSTVEMNGETADNGVQPISTRRIPMNKMFTIIGGFLLTTALFVVFVLTNMPQSTELTPTAIPTLLPTDVSTLTPVVTETSIPPFQYIVESGDTCEFIAVNFNVSVEAIIETNNLSPLCILESGQMLLIPYPSTSPSQSNEAPNNPSTKANSTPTGPYSSYSFPSVSNNPPAEFFGEWVNADSQHEEITRISIQANDGETYINMFGACQPTDCNFREIPSSSVKYSYASGAEILHIEWVMDFVIMTQELTITSDKQLKVKTYEHYVDNSGRLDFEMTEYFTRR